MPRPQDRHSGRRRHRLRRRPHLHRRRRLPAGHLPGRQADLRLRARIPRLPGPPPVSPVTGPASQVIRSPRRSLIGLRSRSMRLGSYGVKMPAGLRCEGAMLG